VVAQGYKLFVGNLSFRTEGQTLRAAFERFGRILDSVVVESRETGQSRYPLVADH
jgi:RNA recognition motif-containing protein